MKKTLVPIIDQYIARPEFDDLTHKHHIQGLLYYFFEYFRDNKEYKQVWLKQWHRNEVYLKELGEISAHFNKLQHRPVLLKGSALTGLIYDDLGSRFMSDVDLLVHKEDFTVCENILELHGFQKHHTPKWKANDFKSEWSKVIEGTEVCIEIHSKLYYHNHSTFDDYKKEASHLQAFDRLEFNELIIHLSTHYGFQHTFLKLYWLFDIYLLIEKDLENIQWKELLLIAKRYKVVNSFLITMQCLKDYFGLDIPKALFIKHCPHISMDFLWSDNRRGLEYFKIKHLCKDSLKEAIEYDLRLLLAR